MTLPIRYWPDPILKERCERVPEVTDAVRWLLAEMEATMRAARGLGLAAPQVGRALRAIVVLDVPSGTALQLVNPTIELGPEKVMMREGCLSLPGFFENVSRSSWVKVHGWNEHGDEVAREAEGQLAQALQHEIEHLEGMVFTDHLSQLKRNIAFKKVRKEVALRATDPKEYEEEGERRRDARDDPF